MASYYTDPTTGQQVKIRKTHKFRNFVLFPILGLFAVLILGAAISSGGGSAPAGNGPATAGSDSGHTVRYEVTGEGQGMVTFTTDANMSMAQSTETLPFSTEVPFGNSAFTPVSVNVSRSFQGGTGPLGCTILVDGEVVAENHSSGGQAATVSCNATL